MWFDLAASKSTEEARDRAINRRDFAASKMTPEQIVQARRLAREWKAKTWEELKGE